MSKEMNIHSGDNADKVFKKTFEPVAGLIGLGGVAELAEPFLKGMTELDIAKVDSFFANKGILFDARFLREQLTDCVFMIGSFPIICAIGETAFIDPLPDEGKWGIPKENLRTGFKVGLAGVFIAAALSEEVVDVLLTHNHTFAIKDLDSRDMRAFLLGLMGGVIVTQIWEWVRQNSVEINQGS